MKSLKAFIVLTFLSSLCFGSFLVPNNSITTQQLSSLSVTNVKLAAKNIVSSNVTSIFSTTSTTPVAVTGLSNTITTVGRPIDLYLTSNIATPSLTGALTTNTSESLSLQVLRGSTVVCTFLLATGATTASNIWPSSSIRCLDVPSAGTYTYTVKINSGAGGSVSIEGSFVTLEM